MTSDPDVLLVELAAAGARSITVRCWPKRSGGRFAVLWRQDGRRRTAEGTALPVALRRAVRAARAVSGDTSKKEQAA